MDFSDQLSQAMHLPTANYYTPKLAHLKKSEVLLVDMCGTAVTNATSGSPVIGTVGFGPCLAVVLYNKKTKTALVTHQPLLHQHDIHHLLSQVRASDAEPIDVHVMGGAFATQGEAQELSENNGALLVSLEAIMKAMNENPNVTLKTFDVFDKPKPHAVAIDARDGTLIRGSELHRTSEEADVSLDTGRDMFDGCYCLPRHENFDGTLPEEQIQRSH